MQRLDVAVLGGGVAGLTAAYLLRERPCRIIIETQNQSPRARVEPAAGALAPGR